MILPKGTKIRTVVRTHDGHYFAAKNGGGSTVDATKIEGEIFNGEVWTGPGTDETLTLELLDDVVVNPQ